MTFQPVPAASIAVMFLDLIVSVGVPIGLLIMLRKKTGARISAFLWGCLSFVLFAMVLERLMHSAVLGGALGARLTENLWLYAVYGGLAAGIFEEAGRFVFLSILLKKGSERQNALMYGAGHGGIEAVLIVGLSYVNNLIYSFMINLGQAETVLAAVGEETRAAMESVFVQLSTTPPTLFLAAGAERIVAIALHIALSVLVYTGVRRKRFGYVLLAVAFHALVDLAAVVLNSLTSVWVLELVVLAMTVLIGLYAAKLYRAARAPEQAAAPAAPDDAAQENI